MSTQTLVMGIGILVVFRICELRSVNLILSCCLMTCDKLTDNWCLVYTCN